MTLRDSAASRCVARPESAKAHEVQDTRRRSFPLAVRGGPCQAVDLFDAVECLVRGINEHERLGSQQAQGLRDVEDLEYIQKDRSLAMRMRWIDHHDLVRGPAEHDRALL